MRCYHHLRWAGFALNVNGLLGQDVHVLQGGEEHTHVVRRLDRLADHVDGLFAHFEVDASFTLFSSRLPCSSIVSVEITGCPDPQQMSMILSALRSLFHLGLVELPKQPLNLNRRRHNTLGSKSRIISDDCGVLNVWFVVSMRFVSNRQLVHHVHVADALRRPLQVHSFPMESLPPPATSSRTHLE